MRMQVLTIIQFIVILVTYLLVTVGLPALVMRAKLRGRRFLEQFMMSMLVGNFYVMNIVFFLELLKICNRATLIIFTLVPAIVIGVKINKIPVKAMFVNSYTQSKRIYKGSQSRKTVIWNIFGSISKGIKWVIVSTWKCFAKRPLQWAMVLAILALLGYVYGQNLLRVYGYTASDTPVHLEWINGMDKNHIFYDGVYPFGYHNMIFYLHKVFNIDSYVYMRVFSFVQCIMLHLSLLATIRLCTKSKYVGYAVVGLYVFGGFLQPSTYLRFFAVLPQEYGMIFIMPSAYFLFKFFKVKQKEIKKDLPKTESRLCLGYFAISFAMTLAVHFYGTIIAGIFCAGIGCGYIAFFVRKKYFLAVMGAGILSVMLAVLPMGIAFATGTPLQGSLDWAMGVINGTGNQNATSVKGNNGNNKVEYYDSEGNQVSSYGEDGKIVASAAAIKAQQSSTAVKEPLQNRLIRVFKSMCETIDNSVLNEPRPWYYLIIIGSFGVLIALGIFFFLMKKQRFYGMMLLSTGIYLCFMWVLQNAALLGLPELMDGSRCRIYFAYSIAFGLALAVDGIINLLIMPRILGKIRDFLSLLFVGLIVVILIPTQNQKVQADSTALVTDEAITCLSNILRNEKDHTWTIVSANDELQMTINRGFHYEIIDFLKNQEYNNMDDGIDSEPVLKIPTPNVFLFIEKKPLDYTIVYENSGQSISNQGALKDLPPSNGISMYMGEARWICMSKMNEWAKAFKKLYPNEVNIYFENDNFICYKIKQNPYRLFNCAIDYGFNTYKAKAKARNASKRKEAKK